MRIFKRPKPPTEQPTENVQSTMFDDLLRNQATRQRKRLMRDPLSGEVYDLSEKIDLSGGKLR